MLGRSLWVPLEVSPGTAEHVHTHTSMCTHTHIRGGVPVTSALRCRDPGQDVRNLSTPLLETTAVGIRLWSGRISLRREKDGGKPSGESLSCSQAPPCLQHTLLNLIPPHSHIISKHPSDSSPFHSSPTWSHTPVTYNCVCYQDPNKEDAPRARYEPSHPRAWGCLYVLPASQDNPGAPTPTMPGSRG